MRWDPDLRRRYRSVARGAGDTAGSSVPGRVARFNTFPSIVLTLAFGSAVVLVSIWFGYPLVIAGLAALLRHREEFAETPEQHVSVIIATLDTPEVIRARVEDVLATDYPRHLIEVVVALDAAGTVRASAMGGLGTAVRVVEGDLPGGKATTLNAAVRGSAAEVLVFTDAAQRFDRFTIPRLVEALRDERLGAVSGALHIGTAGRPASLGEWYWKFEKWLRLQEARVHSTVGVTGAVYAMRRGCWVPLPAGLILDDVYGPMHLVLRGYRVGFSPAAEAYDSRRFAPAQEFRRKARTLTGVLQLCAWLPDVLVPWRNPIWAQFVFHKLLRLATPYLLVIMLLSVVLWAELRIGSRAPLVATGVLAGAIVAAALVLALSRRLRDGVKMAMAMQAAVLRATVNGFRGRWDVWSR